MRHGGISKMKPYVNGRRYSHTGLQPVCIRYMKGPSEVDGRQAYRAITALPNLVATHSPIVTDVA